MGEKCWLDDPEWRQCCCNCKHYVKLNLHCSFGLGLLKRADFGDKCICSTQVAWVCAVATTVYGHEDYIKGEHSSVNLFGISEHDLGCELYDAIKKQTAEASNA